ncbi:unnamed protein product [Haemonchus placei]|uniref:LITAF domain-containing protein n=1 Tax=Haemonchus placei TaxID=6290 RepID=A0A0N4WKN5_HAEPC|nr:unnamed protein product [Haemonchus placei]
MNIVFAKFILKPIVPQALSNSASIRYACPVCSGLILSGPGAVQFSST